MIETYNWSIRVLWAIVGIAGCWFIYLVSTDYSACRVDGTGTVACFFIALIFGFFKALFFVCEALYKFLLLVLP